MISCFCCWKKRGEVYLLRNRAGTDNHGRNSDDSLTQNNAERGEINRETQEEQEMFDNLHDWANNLRNRNAHNLNVGEHGTMPAVTIL